MAIKSTFIGTREEPPRGWREGHGATLACPHRDVSVCPSCAAANPEAVDVLGQHFWIVDPAERAALRAAAASAITSPSP